MMRRLARSMMRRLILCVLVLALLPLAGCVSYREARDRNVLLDYLAAPDPSPQLTARVDKIMARRGAALSYGSVIPHDSTRDCWKEAGSSRWHCNE